MQLLKPSPQQLIVKSPVEGSLKSKSKFETTKKRVIYKNNKGEVVDINSQPSNQLINKKSRTVTPAASETAKSLTQLGQYQLLDLVPLDDPLWQELIPQEMFNDPNFSLQQLVAENQEYFMNLIGLYMQERTLNKMQESKFTLPNKKITTYDQEYRQTQRIDSQANFNPKMYESNIPTQSIPIQSQYDASFKQPKLHTAESTKLAFQPDKSQMFLLTSYQSNYVDWKHYKPERVHGLRNVSIGSLPFIAKTSYQECFRYSQCEPNQSMKKKSQLGPFATGGGMIFKESLNKQHYQRPQTQQSQVAESNFRTPVHNQAYDGQFKTTFREYNNIIIRSYCQKQPEQVTQDRYWKQKLIQKLIDKKIN